MDAEDLKIILDNTRGWWEDAYNACVQVLFREQALPEQPEYPGLKEGYVLAQKLGGAVKAMVWEYAAREHGLTEDDTDSLSGAVFATAVMHVSDADLGALYYVTVRERYCYEHDMDPYPA